MAYVLPRPLSYSSFSLYEECPQKYKFKYVDRIPEKPKHYFSFGQSVHLALEFFYAPKAPPPPSLEELLNFYRDHWVSRGYKDAATEARYKDDGESILTLFYRKHSGDWAPPLFVEYHFNVELADVPLTGKVDRIDKLPDGRLSIIDYKTGKAMNAERLAEDSQLAFYQMACEKSLGAEVAKLSFYHLPSLTEHAIARGSGEKLDRLTSRLTSVAAAVTRGIYEPAPQEKKCFFCDYKPLCPVFKQDPPERSAVSDDLPDARLSELIDRLGELLKEAAAVKKEILSVFKSKGYARAFGSKFSATRAPRRALSFPDKKSVLDLLRQAALYDRVLAPSQGKIEALLTDPTVSPDIKARLSGLSAPADDADISIEPASKNGGFGFF